VEWHVIPVNPGRPWPRCDPTLILSQLALRDWSNGCAQKVAHKEHSMMDVLMLAIAFGFFALAIGYTYACERL
jgi:hypothetical protein